MKLLEIRLPERMWPGMDLCFPGWTGNELKFSNFWANQGFDGLHAIGGGNRGTHLMGEFRSLVIGRNAGLVVLENMTIHVGKSQAIYAAPDSWQANPKVPLKLVLRNCTIVADTVSDEASWGVFTYQSDVECVHCDFYCEKTTEHAIYAHGWGNEGMRVVDCRFWGSGAEAIKGTNRPDRQYYPANHLLHLYGTEDLLHPTRVASVVIDNCFIQNWHQPHSFRGGGGIVMQGTAADIYIKDTVLRANAGKCKCICIDDSGERHFGYHTEIGGAEPANGRVVLERVLCEGQDGPVLFIDSTPHKAKKKIVESLDLIECGFFGRGGRLDLHETAIRSAKKCMTPEVLRYAENLGMDVGNPIPVRSRV